MGGTIDLELVAQFIAVAEAGSLSAAAARLGLAKSSLSRNLHHLEAAVGAELLHRSTRRLALSTAGAALYERAAPLVGALADAVRSLPEREEAPSGELRVTAPVDLGVLLLADVIARFTARHPAVRVDLHLTARKVDLIGEGFDLAIRATAGRMRDSSLAMRRLSPVEAQLYAAPTYLARRGPVREPGDTAHDWVEFRPWHARRELRLYDVQRTSTSSDPTVAFPRSLRERSGPHPRLRCDDFFFVREALKAGAGVGWLPSFLAEPYLATGELQRVLPGERLSLGGFVLLYPSVKRLPRKVTAFRDFLLEAVRARPLAPQPE